MILKMIKVVSIVSGISLKTPKPSGGSQTIPKLNWVGLMATTKGLSAHLGCWTLSWGGSISAMVNLGSWFCWSCLFFRCFGEQMMHKVFRSNLFVGKTNTVEVSKAEIPKVNYCKIWTSFEFWLEKTYLLFWGYIQRDNVIQTQASRHSYPSNYVHQITGCKTLKFGSKNRMIIKQSSS